MNKLKKICIFFLLYSFCFVMFANAQSPNVISGEKGKKIDELVSAYHREGLLNGTVLVAERGKVVYKRGFGFANMEFKVPNASDTKFRIASISKSIVAVLTMRLVEQGKLSLDAKVSDYLPDYRKDIADKVTVKHLLSHTSGIPDTLMHPGLWEREIRDPFTPQEILARYSSGALEFEPGTRLKYGTTAYVLLSLMIEKATGKPFEQSMSEEVLEPLGMRDTGMEGASPILVRNEQGRSALKGSAPIIERMATGYMKVNNAYSRSPFMDMTHGSAGGWMYSTVEDLFRLDRALYDDKFLSRQTREKMFTPVLSDTGLGWNARYLSFPDLQQPFLNIVDPPRTLREAPADFKIVYKLGDLWGFSGTFARLPNEGHTIIVLVNVNNRAVYFDLETVRVTQGVMNILFDKPYFTPRERMFAEIIEQRGFEKAVQTFKQLKRKEPQSAIIREFEFNILGYEILGKKKFAQAIGVFKLNVEAHPNSANTYDSLAEAYLAVREKELALKFYKKALEVNSSYPNAKAAAEIVKKLETELKVNSKN
jgi:CubicO group peptidase (beta-lactamase class C family)